MTHLQITGFLVCKRTLRGSLRNSEEVAHHSLSCWGKLATKLTWLNHTSSSLSSVYPLPCSISHRSRCLQLPASQSILNTKFSIRIRGESCMVSSGHDWRALTIKLDQRNGPPSNLCRIFEHVWRLPQWSPRFSCVLTATGPLLPTLVDIWACNDVNIASFCISQQGRK